MEGYFDPGYLILEPPLIGAEKRIFKNKSMVLLFPQSGFDLQSRILVEKLGHNVLISTAHLLVFHSTL